MIPRVNNYGDFQKYHQVYQPIVDLTSGTKYGLESFLRNSNGKSPIEIFRTAKENNCLTELDLNCMKVSIQEASKYPGKLFVNIFSSTIPELAKKVSNNSFSLPQNLVIEIIEVEKLKFNDKNAQDINILRERGIEFAVDDITSGYNRLQLIPFIKPDYIKIDKPLLDIIESSQSAWVVAKHLVKMGKELQAKVIAEGIESRLQLEIVHSLGVSYGQGYFIASPTKLIN